VETDRTGKDAYGKFLFSRTETADAAVIGAVQALAAELGCTMAQVAMAWTRQKPGVTAPIVGFTKASQLQDAVDGLTLTLTPDQIARLEAPYIPHQALGQE
jgi:aryl-alcohol dehydrogenase-like predicted oxidoreductase